MPRKWKKRGVQTRRQKTAQTIGIAVAGVGLWLMFQTARSLIHGFLATLRGL